MRRLYGRAFSIFAALLCSGSLLAGCHGGGSMPPAATLRGANANRVAATAGAGDVGQWTQFLGNAQHTSYSADPQISSATAATTGVAWMANLFSAALGSPVTAFNAALNKQVVYVGNERGDVFALDASTGQIIWSTNVGYNNQIRATPAVTPNGSVFVATSTNAALYKLDGATGQIECSVKSPNGQSVFGSPLLVPRTGLVNIVYWSAIDSGIYGPLVATKASDCSSLFVDSNVESGIWATAAFATTTGGQGLIVVGTADPSTKELAFDATTGAQVWSFQTYNPGNASDYDIGDGASISLPGRNGFADGVVYVNNKSGNEYALDLATGAQIWNYQMYPSGFTGARNTISSAALDGRHVVFGYASGLADVDAITGVAKWNRTMPAEVATSPAILGPGGSEVVVFADVSGKFRLASLSSGADLYQYQTSGYIAASPAEHAGTIFISSSDGFLYAFRASGGNGARPSTTVTSPANGTTVANPNGTLTISGTASDAVAVSAVSVAIQSGGGSGPWFNAATNTWNNAPIENAATLATPGSASTNWMFALPVPTSGNSYKVIVNAVNANHLVDKGSSSTFTVSAGSSQPSVSLSTTIAPPGGTVVVSGSGYSPNETVSFGLLGTTVASVPASSTGTVRRTAIVIPSNAPFGPASITLSGATSGLVSTATVRIENTWAQFGFNGQRIGYEPNDEIISNTVTIAWDSILGLAWKYTTGAPIRTQPAVRDGVAYFGNDNGKFFALGTQSGSPMWTYTVAGNAPIRSSTAIDGTGNIAFGADDGNVYIVDGNGTLLASVPEGGPIVSLGSQSNAFIAATSTGVVSMISEPGWAPEWSINAGSGIQSAPALVSTAHELVVGTSAGNVNAYSSLDGSQLWSNATGGAINAVMVAGTTAYAGSSDGNLYAYDIATGNQLFAVPADSAVNAVIVSQHGIEFVTANGTLYEIDRSGNLYFSEPTLAGGPLVGVSAAAKDTFLSAASGLIMVARANSTSHAGITWSYHTHAALYSAPAVQDGTLYVAGGDGAVYAFTPHGAQPLP